MCVLSELRLRILTKDMWHAAGYVCMLEQCLLMCHYRFHKWTNNFLIRKQCTPGLRCPYCPM